MTQEIDRFIAEAEDGTQHTVVVTRDFLRSTSLNDQPEDIPSLINYATSTGLKLRKLPGNPCTFEVVQTNQVIRQRR